MFRERRRTRRTRTKRTTSRTRRGGGGENQKRATWRQLKKKLRINGMKKGN